MTEDTALSRRGFLRAAAGSAAAAGAAGGTAAQEGNESDGGNQSDGGNETGGNQTGGNESDGGNQSDGGGGGGGQETVTVGPGGELVFDPDSLQVQPGTTVVFEWDSDQHNIVVENKPDESGWEGHEPIEDSGFTHEHTFEVEGSYEYFCQPHQSAGMEASLEVTQDAGGGGGEGGGGPPPVPDSAKSLGVATTIGMLSTLGLAYFFLKYGGDYETPE